MGRFLFLLFSLAGFAALLNFVPGCSVSQAADELEANANAAFADAGISGATANVGGNVMRVTGDVPAGRKADVRGIAEGVRCEACEDKFHEVVDDTVEAAPVVQVPTADPYTLQAVLDEDGTVTLNGFVPSEAALAQVLARAEADFPGNVVNRTLRVANGAPANWTEAAMLNIDELEHLERGRLTMNNTDVLLVGVAESLEERQAIRELAGNEPANFNQVLNIEVAGELADNVGQLDSDALCQELLDELNNENAIQFDVDEATLSAGRPIEVLNSLAGAVKQCDGFNVMVEGHTSTPADDAYNLDLSKRRAATVVAYLVNEQGIDAAKIASEGYGETRLKVEPEVTEADRAANRRIEFIVSR